MSSSERVLSPSSPDVPRRGGPACPPRRRQPHWVDPKFQDRFAVERRPPLDDSLKKAGLAVEDVHMVINTHLHFDHCGGNTHRENGQVVPAFPKAKYFVQRGEYEDAVRANERTRA